MFKAAPIFVATGTYDSFALEAPESRGEEVLRWLRWTMEVGWPELNDWRFPAEVMSGMNLGKFDIATNPQGLRELHGDKPFTMAPLAHWR